MPPHASKYPHRSASSRRSATPPNSTSTPSGSTPRTSPAAGARRSTAKRSSRARLRTRPPRPRWSTSRARCATKAASRPTAPATRSPSAATRRTWTGRWSSLVVQHRPPGEGAGRHGTGRPESTYRQRADEQTAPVRTRVAERSRREIVIRSTAKPGEGEGRRPGLDAARDRRRHHRGKPHPRRRGGRRELPHADAGTHRALVPHHGLPGRQCDQLVIPITSRGSLTPPAARRPPADERRIDRRPWHAEGVARDQVEALRDVEAVQRRC